MHVELERAIPRLQSPEQLFAHGRRVEDCRSDVSLRTRGGFVNVVQHHHFTVGPLHHPGVSDVSIGAVIAQTHADIGNLEEAEVWYRRILRLSPYEPDATAGLALILAEAGDLRQALTLCRNLQAAGSGHPACDELLENAATIP